MLVVQYMESLGNDFVIIDGVTQFFEPSSKEISKILNFDHDFSIDQVMVILPPSDSRFDFQIKIFKNYGPDVCWPLYIGFGRPDDLCKNDGQQKSGVELCR